MTQAAEKGEGSIEANWYIDNEEAVAEEGEMRSEEERDAEG
jgi:hypothetical protein